MSTIIRAEISYKSPYYISRHRYYELKHHCLQYDEWRKRLEKASISLKSPLYEYLGRNTKESDITGLNGASRAFYERNMKTVEDISKDAGGDIAKFIFLSVTKGKSYAALNPPCSKEYFYTRYRKFFYLLDKEI